MYAYTAASAFPTGSFSASNYWVDVLYAAAPAPAPVTAVTATAERGAASVSWTAPSSGGAPTSYEIAPYIGLDAQAPRP